MEQLSFTILFVCTGNTCRSAMAEGIMKGLILKDKELKDIKVLSAGLGVYFPGPASSNAKKALESMNINIEEHKSKSLTPEMVSNADVILTMTMSHKLAVLGILPKSEKKVT